MITLNELELVAVEGGNAAEDWGAQAAADGLDNATSANPLLWVPGVTLAVAGAAAYYGGWAWSSLF